MKPGGWGLFLVLGASLLAQVSTSRITGSIQDSTGAVVPGAAVTIRNEATGETRAARASEAGTYTFDAIPTGFYTVEIEAKGFKKTALRANEVRIGQPTTVNATLEIGQLTETVEVSGGAELVQTSTSGNYGNVLTERTITDMPIVGTRGRNPLQLVLLQPGTFDGANTGGGYHVHGARDRAWNFTLDGIDNNDPSAGGSNFAPTRTNPDSISEFRVVTSNPTADVGRNSGANVLLVTKGGTNEFHGNGFWFYRTPRLNANEWANNFNNLGKRQFVQNIYGGSLGGPVWQNNTFFFVNIQRLRASETRTVNRRVYTAPARQGILRYVSGGRNRPFGATDASVDAAGNPPARPQHCDVQRRQQRPAAPRQRSHGRRRHRRDAAAQQLQRRRRPEHGLLYLDRAGHRTPAGQHHPHRSPARRQALAVRPRQLGLPALGLRRRQRGYRVLPRRGVQRRHRARSAERGGELAVRHLAGGGERVHLRPQRVHV